MLNSWFLRQGLHFHQIWDATLNSWYRRLTKWFLASCVQNVHCAAFNVGFCNKWAFRRLECRVDDVSGTATSSSRQNLRSDKISQWKTQTPVFSPRPSRSRNVLQALVYHILKPKTTSSGLYTASDSSEQHNWFLVSEETLSSFNSFLVSQNFKAVARNAEDSPANITYSRLSILLHFVYISCSKIYTSSVRQTPEY